MTTQFSPDLNPSPRGTAPAKEMRQAAQRAHGSGQKAAGGAQSHAGGRKGHQAGGETAKHRIGRPAPSQEPQQQPDQPHGSDGDYRHVALLSHFENMQRLGRQASFGIWAHLNGHTADLLQPGQAFFDTLEDV